MKIKYPDDYNPIQEYWEQIETGKVVVSDKIYRTYKKIVYDLNCKCSVYYYSHRRANHMLEFAENYCRHIKGKLGGQLVELELWEKALLATVFGFIDMEGNRKYREAVLIVAKKNGKSLIASIVGLYMMIADQEPGAEVYAVATKRDQAKIVWEVAKKMVKKSPKLKSKIKPLTYDLTAEFNDSVFKALASDSDTLDGLNVHCVLMDEWHQWKNGMALYNIMADGKIGREQALSFMTSTAGTVREDIYDIKYDEAEQIINGYFDPDGVHDENFIAFIYELDHRKEWTDPKMWPKANPGLGTIKKTQELARKVEKAKVNPMLVKNLVCKEFNIRETSTESWLTFDQLNNKATFELENLKPRYGIGGVDLSKTTDLTAAKVIFMLRNDPTIYSLAMYWLPEDLLEKRAKEDKIPYEKWKERGLLRTTPGNTINPKYVTEWFVEVQNELDIYIPWIGYDAWSASYWAEEMQGYFGKEAMIKVYQGKKTLSGPMHELGADLEAKKVNYNNNPIDKWCLSNTSVDTDKNGNIQPVKSKNQRRRIDGTAALLNAYVVLKDKLSEYQSMI